MLVANDVKCEKSGFTMKIVYESEYGTCQIMWLFWFVHKKKKKNFSCMLCTGK